MLDYEMTVQLSRTKHQTAESRAEVANEILSCMAKQVLDHVRIGKLNILAWHQMPGKSQWCNDADLTA